ncbi:AAA+ ATPase domain-containing protein [Tumidithrix helvetica PCC 7403]|uniref:AAA family ATPase n=1 Tax=Tumidithrix helvetica TaxID=3457545 RepID=UPI003C93E3E0
MFNITHHVDFDSKGRAQCPCCLSVGKTAKNLALIPNTDGAYKCHRGCTPDDIRSAIGHPRNEDVQIPKAIATNARTNKPKYHTPQELKANTDKLLTQSKLAKQWLSDRGIDADDIARHRLGIVTRKIITSKDPFEFEMLPCISIPYEINTGQWLQKYYVLPWLPKAERVSKKGVELQRVQQDSGLAATWWFTRKSESKELWVCEGEWDAMVMAKIAQADVVTSTTGAGNVPKDLSPFDQYQQITIWYDLDDAGKVGAEKLANAIGPRAKIATVPHKPESKEGWDISDAIKDGFTIDQFNEAAKLAIAPPWPAGKKSALKDRLSTTAELMARAKDYTDWLIDEILPINELILLAASPRAGKSLMAMNIAQCVASGSNFLDRPVTQGSVIYVQCEDSETKTKQRAIAQGWDENLPVYWLEKFKLSELSELIDLAKEIEPRLIVLDTLSRVRDDNTTESSAEMGRILEPLQEFARDHNCCILPIHHTGKIKLESADALDVFETIRGSSAIRATCRGTLVIAANEQGYRLCIENGYNKQDLKVSLDLNTLTWRLLGKWGIQADASQADQVLDYLTKVEHATLEQLHESVGINKPSLYKVLSRLVHDEKISKTGSRKAVVYSRLLQKLAKAQSDISDMSDTLSDSETRTVQSIEVLSDKKSISLLSDNMQVQKSVGDTTPDRSKLSDCQVSSSTPDTASVSESDKLPDKTKVVRYEIGDRVEIRTGRFTGKAVEVVGFDGELYEVKGKTWAVTQFYPQRYLFKLEVAP